MSWNGLEDGLAPLAAAIQKGGGAPLKSLNLAGTRPTDEVSTHLVVEVRSQQSSGSQMTHALSHLVEISVIKDFSWLCGG